MVASIDTVQQVKELTEEKYKYGFFTDIESETAPKGLNEDIVRFISAKKNEPEWLLEWRLKAYRYWLTMLEPKWSKVIHEPIDYQDAYYYSAPKSAADGPQSLDEIDPQLLETYEKLGIPLKEQERLSGVAVDAVFDSVSVATTFKAKLGEVGVIFCPISEALESCPDLVKKYLGTVVPYTDNKHATLNSAVFTDGSFVYIPPGVRCPMELSTYFRINAANTGQFERTLIIADKGSYVSYLEGCTAPMRDEHQLHAAVVELIALDDAEIKYSTIQNWYPGDENGRGGIFNFVTKRGHCRGRNSKISWTQVETGAAITWKYPSCILKGDNSVGEFYSIAITNNYQQADTGTKMIHLGKNTSSRIISKGIFRRPRQSDLPGTGPHIAQGQRGAELHPVRFAPHRRPMRRPHGALHRMQEQKRHRRTRGDDLDDLGRPVVLPAPARHPARGSRRLGGQRVLPRGVAAVADGIRRRGAEAGRHQPRRKRRLGPISGLLKCQKRKYQKRKLKKCWKSRTCM